MSVTLRYGLVFEINRENLIMYASIIIKYAQFVLKMKFSSTNEQRILCLFFTFCSAKITVKVINEYIRTISKTYTSTRHERDLCIRKCFL